MLRNSHESCDDWSRRCRAHSSRGALPLTRPHKRHHPHSCMCRMPQDRLPSCARAHDCGCCHTILHTKSAAHAVHGVDGRCGAHCPPSQHLSHPCLQHHAPRPPVSFVNLSASYSCHPPCGASLLKIQVVKLGVQEAYVTIWTQTGSQVVYFSIGLATWWRVQKNTFRCCQTAGAPCRALAVPRIAVGVPRVLLLVKAGNLVYWGPRKGVLGEKMDAGKAT